ncbi:hypothetical protein VKT23_005486 [Stygiomarasmius scandens]|uniref:Uncharacterized protein n=1 Tax=Marasmiellus scandens TaxID=2682957 RepID=A0ABR1JUU1_9AGAR
MTSSTQVKLRDPVYHAYRPLVYCLYFLLPVANLTVFILQLDPEWSNPVILVLTCMLWIYFALLAPVFCVDEVPKNRYFAPVLVLQLFMASWLALVYLGKNLTEPKLDDRVFIPFMPLVYLACESFYELHLRSLGVLDETVKGYLRYVRWPRKVLSGSLRWLLGHKLPADEEAVLAGRPEPKLSVAPQIRIPASLQQQSGR